MFEKRKAISREVRDDIAGSLQTTHTRPPPPTPAVFPIPLRQLYEWCIREGYADGNLIAKWKKAGYQRLCCLRCCQTKDTNFGTTCICRVPRAHLEAGRVVECQHCGCRGCASGDGGAEMLDVRTGTAVEVGRPSAPAHAHGHAYGHTHAHAPAAPPPSAAGGAGAAMGGAGGFPSHPVPLAPLPMGPMGPMPGMSPAAIMEMAMRMQAAAHAMLAGGGGAPGGAVPAGAGSGSS